MLFKRVCTAVAFFTVMTLFPMLTPAAPAAPASREAAEERLDAESPMTRAVSAYLLARRSPADWAARVVPVACEAVESDDEPGDARFGVLALLSIGRPAEGALRRTLRSRDDQAVACAMIALTHGGVLTEGDLALAWPALDRLSGGGGEEAEVVVEAFRALGPRGRTLMRLLLLDLRPGSIARSLRLGTACAAASPWLPENR